MKRYEGLRVQKTTAIKDWQMDSILYIKKKYIDHRADHLSPDDDQEIRQTLLKAIEKVDTAWFYAENELLSIVRKLSHEDAERYDLLGLQKKLTTREYHISSLVYSLVKIVCIDDYLSSIRRLAEHDKKILHQYEKFIQNSEISIALCQLYFDYMEAYHEEIHV